MKTIALSLKYSLFLQYSVSERDTWAVALKWLISRAIYSHLIRWSRVINGWWRSLHGNESKWNANTSISDSKLIGTLLPTHKNSYVRTGFFFNFDIQIVQSSSSVIPAGYGKIQIHFECSYTLRYATQNLISVLQVVSGLYPDSRATSERNMEGDVSVVFGVGQATCIC